MPADDLRSLHERVVSVLARKISAEKARLDQKLRQLSGGAETSQDESRAAPLPEGFSEV